MKRGAIVACATAMMSAFTPASKIAADGANSPMFQNDGTATYWHAPRECRALPGQRRGLFIYFNDFDTYNGGISFTKALDEISCSGFNIILPEAITSQGYANYRNGLVAQNPDVFNRVGSGKDPMQELIDSAKERNVRVWPWIPMFIGNYQLRREHPEWFAISAYGRHSNFLDPLNEGARKYQAKMIAHLVEKYDVQGINLDLELPIDHISYSENDKRMFMHENGIENINWPGDVLQNGRYHERWLRWVNGKIVDFLSEVHREVKRINPNVVISYDVTRNPDVDNYYSHWQSWAMYADEMDPMEYWRDSGFEASDVGNITRRDVNLTRENSRHTGVISIIGGSMDATKGMPDREWEVGAQSAMRNGSDGLLVFADICINQNNQWHVFPRVFRKTAQR